MAVVLSAHQPDIFPYAGVFHKMVVSDYFDFAIYDQYVKNRYMSRVKIGRLGQLTWMNVPVEKKSRTRICDITLKDGWQDSLHMQITRQYKDFPYFHERHHVVDNVLDSHCSSLADVGVASILSVKEFLGISVLIDCLGAGLPLGGGGAGVVELINRYEDKYSADFIYLSGSGGSDYIDLGLFDKGKFAYSGFDTVYKCSILTPIFLLKDCSSVFGGEL